MEPEQPPKSSSTVLPEWTVTDWKRVLQEAKALGTAVTPLPLLRALVTKQVVPLGAFNELDRDRYLQAFKSRWDRMRRSLAKLRTAWEERHAGETPDQTKLEQLPGFFLGLMGPQADRVLALEIARLLRKRPLPLPEAPPIEPEKVRLVLPPPPVEPLPAQPYLVFPAQPLYYAIYPEEPVHVELPPCSSEMDARLGTLQTSAELTRTATRLAAELQNALCNQHLGAFRENLDQLDGQLHLLLAQINSLMTSIKPNNTANKTTTTTTTTKTNNNNSSSSSNNDRSASPLSGVAAAAAAREMQTTYSTMRLTPASAAPPLPSSSSGVM